MGASMLRYLTMGRGHYEVTAQNIPRHRCRLLVKVEVTWEIIYT